MVSYIENKIKENNEVLIKTCKEFNEIINVDFTTSLGPACRPAQALKRNNLRKFSSPFDWMMKYNLDIVLKLLNNNFNNFFLQHSELGICGQNRIVRDEMTGMISMHAFPLDKTVESYYSEFISIMRKRYLNLIYLFSKYKFCIVMNRGGDETEEILKFMYEFEKKYNTVKIINIIDDENECINTYKICNSYLYNIQFNDEHNNGRKHSNPDWWLGNIKKWDNVLSKIKLNIIS